MEKWKESQLRQLTFAKNIDSAYPILLSFAENIGFDFCAINVASTYREAHFNTLEINNFSDDWKQRHEQEPSDEIDPVTTHCHGSMLPFVWSKTAYDKAPKRWRALQNEGLRHGWSQSFHREEFGVCSTLSLARSDGPVNSIELYEHFGCLFYITSHMTDLFAQSLPKPALARQPHLSPRELEVVQLSAQGKTAYEISQILSLSERTVNYHVQHLIEKFKVCNKISAVIAAARAGYI
jgi:LuxR family transcriptional regulator